MHNAELHVFNFRDLPHAFIRIGRRTFVGESVIVRGQGGVEIGDDVLIAPRAQILAINHNYADVTRPIIDQGITGRGIVVEDGSWIGAGRMGERHCRAYAALHGAELVGISDLALERGQAIAAKYGATFYPNFREMLPHVDAVTIATRTEMHFPVAIECLKRGIHVLIEKPLASDLEQAAELVDRAERASLVLQVGHIERFNPAFLELESVLEDFE